MEMQPLSVNPTTPLATTEEWERRLGEAGRQLRLRAKLTQADLAERANVSLSSVKHFEAGKGSSLATVVRLARALGRADWLESLAPPASTFSPLAVLHDRRRAEAATPQRVRHAPSGRAPS
jgi:transcriptional regulator with XRE-family HTH domain